MITDINEVEMVSVPRQVLQDLVDNCELAVAGMGKGEEVVGYQCRELQRYLGEEPTDEEISSDEFDNVDFVDFKKPV
jgi:hypothetical protein